MTIREAISKVLEDAGKPLSAQDIYEQIKSGNLYEFKAQHPSSIVRNQLRRHTLNIKSAAGTKVKYFEQTSDGNFKLLAAPVTTEG